MRSMKIGDYLKYSLILLLSALFFLGLPPVAKGGSSQTPQDKTDGGPITITTQPVSQSVAPGEKVRLEVKATGGVKLEMIYVPPGTFTMGSPTDETGRSTVTDETQHQVTLTKGFWLGKYLVTQSQYRAVMGEKPASGKGEGADYPVYNVSWNDAVDFCERLTEMQKAAGRLPAGYVYTLPTEAQWEYACRAGTTTALNSGKNLTSDYGPCSNLNEVGWYEENSDYTTHKVGEKKPNAWGFYDMHGNVEEWCLDWKGDYLTGSVIDPKGPDTGEFRVLRGGSWGHGASSCRSAFRDCSGSGGSSYGFRVALSPVE